MIHHSGTILLNVDSKNTINTYLSTIDNIEIPEYTTDNSQKLYVMFYNKYGCFIIRSVYSSKDMDEFNS